MYVEVLATALDATVKVNSTVATTHESGFSIFRADIADLCRDGGNELTIEVSNEDTPSMYPTSADFTFYGGLYRGVNLISVPNAHFDLDYYGGPGIMVISKPTADGGATFEMWAMIKKMIPEAMAGMISTMPDSFIESLNAQLIKKQ